MHCCRGRRGPTMMLACLSLLVATLVAPAASAAIPDQEGTVTRSATATWSIGDARNTTVTITPTVEQVSSGGSVATTRTLVVDLIQDYCDTSGAHDLWVYVDMGATVTNTKYIEAFENGYQKAKGKLPLTLTGTITWTPVGHNNTCAVATGPSWTDTFSAAGKVDAGWEPDKSAAPVTNTTPDTFTWTRAAIAKGGKIEFKALALRHYLLAEDASGAVLSLVAHATDGSDPSTMFAIKP